MKNYIASIFIEFGILLICANICLATSKEIETEPDISENLKSEIIRTILSGNVEEVKFFVKKQPQFAATVAAVYAKHVGFRGKEAGEMALEFIDLIGANAAQASEIIIAICEKTNASYQEVFDMMVEIHRSFHSKFRHAEIFDEITAAIEAFSRVNGTDDTNISAFMTRAIQSLQAREAKGPIFRGESNEDDSFRFRENFWEEGSDIQDLIQDIVSDPFLGIAPGVDENDEDDVIIASPSS